MHSSNKHSTIKGLLIKLRAWSVNSLHRKYYGTHNKSGRPDKYKNKRRDTIRKWLDKMIDKM